jgi:nucleotide-binding universal stress UspA family protein
VRWADEPERRAFSALVLGSEAQKVLTQGTLPVLVLR